MKLTALGYLKKPKGFKACIGLLQHKKLKRTFIGIKIDFL